jgi:hypothetical protein
MVIITAGNAYETVFQVNNNSQDVIAQNVVATVTLPAGLTLNSIVSDQGAAGPGANDYTLGNVLPNGAHVLTLNVTVDTLADALPITLDVTTDSPDTDLDNNQLIKDLVEELNAITCLDIFGCTGDNSKIEIPNTYFVDKTNPIDIEVQEWAEFNLTDKQKIHSTLYMVEQLTDGVMSISYPTTNAVMVSLGADIATIDNIVIEGTTYVIDLPIDDGTNNLPADLTSLDTAISAAFTSAGFSVTLAWTDTTGFPAVLVTQTVGFKPCTFLFNYTDDSTPKVAGAFINTPVIADATYPTNQVAFSLIGVDVSNLDDIDINGTNYVINLPLEDGAGALPANIVPLNDAIVAAFLAEGHNVNLVFGITGGVIMSINLTQTTGILPFTSVWNYTDDSVSKVNTGIGTNTPTSAADYTVLGSNAENPDYVWSIIDDSITEIHRRENEGNIFYINTNLPVQREYFAQKGNKNRPYISLAMLNANETVGANDVVEYLPITGDLALNTTVFLQGAGSAATMTTSLQAVMPLLEPYEGLGYDRVDFTGETAANLAVFSANGVVDWILVELRSKDDPSIVLHTRAGLLKDTGLILDIDGITNLTFTSIPIIDYYIAIKHRNHLGVMTPIAVDITSIIDFSDTGYTTYGTNAQSEIVSLNRLIAGKHHPNGYIKYSGTHSWYQTSLADPAVDYNKSIVLSSVYMVFDINMNAGFRFTGPSNDNTVILNDTLGGDKHLLLLEQIPSTVDLSLVVEDDTDLITSIEFTDGYIEHDKRANVTVGKNYDTKYASLVQGIVLPAGTTAERPTTATNGIIRYNTDTSTWEGYNGAWVDLDSTSATALSTGTVTPTTYGITSDGGVDDVVLVEADTTNAGLLGSDKWDEIVANTTKVSFYDADASVTGSRTATFSGLLTFDALQIRLEGSMVQLLNDTNLRMFNVGDTRYVAFKVNPANASDITYELPVAPTSNGYVMACTTAGIMSWVDNAINLTEGTTTNTTVDIDSSDGTNATLAAASTTRAGVMTKAKFDEVVLNNAKLTNVSTNLAQGTRTATTVLVTSSDGTDATLVEADTTNAGLLGSDKWDEIVASTAAEAARLLRNLSAYKTSDQSKTTDIVLAIDGDLQVALEINSVYAFEMKIRTSSDAAADLKYGWSFPTGTTMSWSNVGTAGAAESIQTTETTLAGLGVSTFQIVTVFGTIRTSSTAGTFGYTWSQDISDAGATIIKSGSNLIVTKLN